MSKRSSKTSHVLDLITRRTAPSDDYGYEESPYDNRGFQDDIPQKESPNDQPLSGHADPFQEALTGLTYDSFPESQPQDQTEDFPDYELSVSEMMLENEISGKQPVRNPLTDSRPQQTPGQSQPVQQTLQSSHSLEWNEAREDEPRMVDHSKEESPVRNNRLKNMIDDTVDSDESVSLKLMKSLEAYLIQEYPVEHSIRSADDSPKIYLEGEDQTMEKYENKTLNKYGNEFAHERLDTVDSDISGASFAAENRDESESPNDLTPGKYMFVNVAEEIVRSKVPPIMRDYDMCTCERCTNDVVALTLNRIPPKYVVTMKGKLYARINACLPQYQTDMLAAITDSCTTVKNNSRHNSKTR